MRFTLSNFTDSDDRTGEVCELYGSTVLEIPDIVVAKAKRIIQRAVTAQLNGATPDTITRIISEFRATLDHKYPVAKDFENVYDYIYQRLIDANIKKDKEILEEALGYIREMRDTWKEVMKLSKQAGSK